MVDTSPSLIGHREQRRRQGGAMAYGKGAQVRPTVGALFFDAILPTEPIWQEVVLLSGGSEIGL
jgi:hypothetical protein